MARASTKDVRPATAPLAAADVPLRPTPIPAPADVLTLPVRWIPEGWHVMAGGPVRGLGHSESGPNLAVLRGATLDGRVAVDDVLMS